LIDGLTSRRLASRRENPGDRRCKVLMLTAAGRDMLAAARSATQARLAARLSKLSQGDRRAIAQAMELLRRAFAPEDRRGEKRSR
jgi:DNA-binding MarR family transcriptional regulator